MESEIEPPQLYEDMVKYQAPDYVAPMDYRAGTSHLRKNTIPMDYRAETSQLGKTPASATIKQSPHSPLPAPPKQKSSKKKCIFFVMILLIQVLLVGLLAFVVHTTLQTQRNSVQYSTNRKSCKELKDEDGITTSGYYDIRPDEDEQPYTVFCDMETSGGGWTLVASIHENDIERRCSTGDLWFSNDKTEVSDPLATRNWENKNVFGKVHSATSNDYKNSAYYALQASDVMIRHVPQHNNPLENKDDVLLEYHTNNGFLQEYGGNLHSLYNNVDYRLAKADDVAYPDNNVEILDALAADADRIISHIPDFYRYEYPSTSSMYLNGGGQSMFASQGMRITFGLGNTYAITHGSELKFTSYYNIVSSRKSHPFFALANIGDYGSTHPTPYIQVKSYRPITDTVTTYNGTLTEGDFQLKYGAYCSHDMPTPSICDVMYIVSNPEKWKSPELIQDFTPSIMRYSDYYNYQQAYSNSPVNVLLGYTMLSRNAGALVTQGQTESTLRKMLNVISKFSYVGAKCANPSKHLVEPVTYTVGGASAINNIPPSFRGGSAVSGFVQFRAWSSSGTAFALCPSVKVQTCSSEYLCIGGVDTSGGNTYCNDFLNWNAGSSVSRLNVLNALGNAHSQRSILSTILIFYR